jgi:hypothetical protein
LNILPRIKFCGALIALCSEIRHCAKRQNVASNFMTASKNILAFLVGLLFFSCNGTTQVKVQDVKLTEVKSDKNQDPPIPPAPTGLKVSAYLIYKDSTTSTFDVLNDKTIALWNTIIGAGDAVKPSERTKIILTGKLDNLKVTIYNGKRKVESKQLPSFSGDFEFIINNTGCEEVKVTVTRFDKQVYKGAIPFRCGE